MKEIWKEIPGFEGRYEVSNLGRVKSLVGLKDRVMSQGTNKHGYLKVVLRINGKSVTKYVHRLVALTFHGESDLQVDHINHNKKDNRPSNLRYVDNRGNHSNRPKKSKGEYTSKYVGVSWMKNDKVWRASITHEGKNVYLGCFKSEEKASEAYQQELKRINGN